MRRENEGNEATVETTAAAEGTDASTLAARTETATRNGAEPENSASVEDERTLAMDRLRMEFGAAAALDTAVALARTAQVLYSGKKLRAAHGIAEHVVGYLCTYAALADR